MASFASNNGGDTRKRKPIYPDSLCSGARGHRRRRAARTISAPQAAVALKPLGDLFIKLVRMIIGAGDLAAQS